MKAMTEHLSRCFGHDGWAIRIRQDDSNCLPSEPLPTTLCTTREEARELRRSIEGSDPDLFKRLEVVKVDMRLKALVDD